MKKNKKFKNILLTLNTFILVNNNNCSDKNNSDKNNSFINNQINNFKDKAINTAFDSIKNSPGRANPRTALMNAAIIAAKASNDNNNNNNYNNNIRIKKPNNNFKNINNNLLNNNNNNNLLKKNNNNNNLLKNNKFPDPSLIYLLPYLNKKEEIYNSDSSDSDN